MKDIPLSCKIEDGQLVIRIEADAVVTTVCEGESAEINLDTFPSLRRSGERDRLVPYPIRLAQSQIDGLEALRAQRGIIPAEFIRDAVASCLALLRKV